MNTFNENEVIEETPILEVLENDDIEDSVPVIGVVSGCAKLNVREEASVDSEVLGTIKRGTEVEIIEDEFTDEFYKVITASGMEGFCMKEYVTIK